MSGWAESPFAKSKMYFVLLCVLRVLCAVWVGVGSQRRYKEELQNNFITRE
jgi:hypothetical protein